MQQRKIHFSKKKFLSLSVEQQHRKCCQLLRQLFYSQEDVLYQEYLNWSQWLALSPLPYSKETIADRFHEHLQCQTQGVQEGDLLITHQDHPYSAPLLPIVIYLEKIRSAQNVGSILRTTEAFALGRICFSDSRMPQMTHPQVIKTSMGSTTHIETIQEPLAALPKPLIVLETSPQAISIEEFIFPSSFTLAIGNEEYGCSESLLKSADILLSIPLYGRKNSLNVSNAFAIIAAQITLQQR